MTKDEAIHKALKVLNCLNNDRVYETAWVKGAINACEEALEQPAQEPVAWYGKDTAFLKANKIFVFNNKDDANAYGIRKSVSINPLYTHPYQWQGLTDDEILKAIAPKGTADSDWNVLKFCDDLLTIGRAIQQALKDKNT